uniref:CEP41 n=1 Tax=Panagrellus redivivus TaxID=6233 RepID=A0A7E4V308_PANRE
MSVQKSTQVATLSDVSYAMSREIVNMSLCRMSNASTSICGSPSGYASASDTSSVDSWHWGSTLDSSDSNFSLEPYPSQHQKIVFLHNAIPLAVKEHTKVFATKSIKLLLKKCSSLVSQKVRLTHWRQVYTIERKPSINLLNPVRLLQYKPIDEKLNPVEFVLKYLCNTVQDVQELRKNPQRVAHLLTGDVDVILQDVAFALSKVERINDTALKKKRPKS